MPSKVIVELENLTSSETSVSFFIFCVRSSYVFLFPNSTRDPGGNIDLILGRRRRTCYNSSCPSSVRSCPDNAQFGKHHVTDGISNSV